MPSVQTRVTKCKTCLRRSTASNLSRPPSPALSCTMTSSTRCLLLVCCALFFLCLVVLLFQEQVAMRVLHTRPGDDVARCAQEYLEHLDEEAYLQMAMVGDFASDCLSFTRWLDDESVESADLQAECSALARRLLVLYQEGECIKGGLTLTAVEHLGRSRLLKLKGGAVKILGGPGSLSSEATQRCLNRIACIAKVALVVLRSEFPSYDLLTAFGSFSLSKSGATFEAHRCRCGSSCSHVKIFGCQSRC